MSVMLYPCIFCIDLPMYMFVLCVACLAVFVNCFLNCLVKQLGIFLGCGCHFVDECYGSVDCGWRCSVG